MAFWSWSSDWVEVVALLVLIGGFILSAFADSLAIKLILIFIVGIMFGRVWFLFKKRGKLALSSLIAGFLLGFLVGNLLDNIGEIVLVFFAGLFVGYYIHKKKLIKII